MNTIENKHSRKLIEQSLFRLGRKKKEERSFYIIKAQFKDICKGDSMEYHNEYN